MTFGRMKLFASVAAGVTLISAAAIADDGATSSAHYEDDAWYDISEWMDGNDYNPTDESVWRWDDEVYNAHEDTSDDWDNDVYGYDDDNTSDRWFYDYYDDNYRSYYTDDVMKYPHDPERAAQLLDEAGWALGDDGYRYNDGEKLSLLLMTTAQNKTRELVQVYLQDQWKQVGIDTSIRNEPARVYFGETVRKAKYPAMAMFAWTARPDQPPRAQLHSSEIPTEEDGYSGQNAPGFVNPIVDDALDRVKNEFDFEQRKALMKVIQQQYAEQVPVIPLYLRSEISVVPGALENYRITGHQFYSTLSADRWSMTMR